MTALDFEQEKVKQVGKIVIEAMKRNGSFETYKTKLEELHRVKEGISATETITVGETDLYSTIMSDFIEKRNRPELVALGLIKQISNIDTTGAGSIKIPIRDALITAVDLPDSGDLTYDTGGYGSETVSFRYSYAANKLTREILKLANVDLMAEELGEIGDAIARKVDGDVIAAFQTATTNANGNRLGVGAAVTVTFATLLTAWSNFKSNDAKPTDMLMSPETEVTLYALDEFKGGNSITGAMAFNSDKGEYFPIANTILNMRVHTSTQVDNDDLFMIDKARTGYLFMASAVETYDGRISGTLAFEVIGAQMYGVGIPNPKALYRLEENSAA